MFPRVHNLDSYETVDKKTDLTKEFSYIEQPITQATEALLINKKEEFLNWLKVKNLDYLLNPLQIKTLFEWKCSVELMNILMHFDSLIEQHDKIFGKPIDRINEKLRIKMEAFSNDYKNESIINEMNIDDQIKLG